MKIRLSCVVFVMLALAVNVSVSADDAGMRTWTATKGQTIEAQFVKLSQGKLYLKKADGSSLTINPRVLSTSDRALARSLAGLPAAAAPKSKPAVKSSSGAKATKVVDWPSTASASGYAEATAGAPDYANKALWPNIGGKEYFLKTEWGPGRIYVWANPGTSTKNKGENIGDSSHWKEYADAGDGKISGAGKTPDKLIFDKDTSIVLPDSEKKYKVEFKMGYMKKAGLTPNFRHITIGKGAGTAFQEKGPNIFGNVWMKLGGSCGGNREFNIVGSEHTFQRVDNKISSYPVVKEKLGLGIKVSNAWACKKDKGSSVEVLGACANQDEYDINNGTVIIGQDSTMAPGRVSIPSVKGGKLILMDGARFSQWASTFNNTDLAITGTLQGGLPDRPLTRNAYVEIQRKNYTSAKLPNGKEYSRTIGMSLNEGSELRSYSATPDGARLVIENPEANGKMKPVYALPKKQAKDVQAKNRAWYENLPKGIDIWFAKGVKVDNVEFRDIHKGGLLTASSGQEASWKNVVYGKGCAGKGKELFSVVPALKNRTNY